LCWSWSTPRTVPFPGIADTWWDLPYLPLLAIAPG
jgi:hypothetical protein